MEFAAALFDGISAARHEVRVRVETSGLWIIERNQRWPWPELAVREDAVLRINRGDALLVVGSESAREVREAIAPYTRVHRIRGHAPAFLISIAVASLLVLWLGYRFVLPWAGERAASAAPLEWEEKLGESASQSLLAGEKVVAEGRAADSVDLVLARLTEALGPTPYHYRVTLVESDVVNAGALPGGRIFVFSGLLKRCDSADEFAAVLAHEMTHVEKRHGMKSLGRQAALGILLSLAGSPDSLAVSFGSQVAGLKYQRGDEDEADREGLRLMAQAGFDPGAASTFFRKLAQQNDGLRLPEYLSTHPDSDARAGRLADLAHATPSAPRPLMSPAEWRAAVAGLH